MCHECSLFRGRVEGYGGDRVRICNECKNGKMRKVHSILGDTEIRPLRPKQGVLS